MEYQVQDIAAFDYPEDGDSGIVGTVKFNFDDHNRDVSVNVRIDLDRDAPFSVIEKRLFEKAKSQLQELAADI